MGPLKLTPTTECVFCSRTLHEVGGKRLVATGSLVVTCRTEPVHGGGWRSYALDANGEADSGFMVVRGDCWEPKTTETALSAFRSGLHPWFCQTCGNRACGGCGSPLAIPMAANILHGDGVVLHQVVLPFDPGCTNSACPRFRPPPE